MKFTNKWGEVVATGSESEVTSPSTPLEFPYHNLTAQLMVSSCDTAWIRFSDDPNFSGGDIQDGYDNYSFRARVDGKEVTESMGQNWGSKDVNYRNGSAVVRGFASEDSYKIYLPHYVGGAVWEFDMSGAKDAIAKTCPSAVN